MKSGFIMLVVLAILGIMSVLAVALVNQAQVSQLLSNDIGWQTRARLVARSGLEQSLTKLLIDAGDPTAQFYGQDLDGNGTVDASELLLAGLPQNNTLLEDALRPSFSDGIQRTIEGKVRVFSGSYHDSLYRLQIIGLASTIDLNGGIDGGRISGGDFATDHAWSYTASDTSHPFNVPTVRWLNALGDVLKYLEEKVEDDTYDWDQPFNGADSGQLFHPTLICEADGTPSLDVVHPENQLGTRLIKARPSGGFTDQDWDVIKTVVNTFGQEMLNREKLFDLIQPWLALHPYRDLGTTIIVPVNVTEYPADLNLGKALPPDSELIVPPPPPPSAYYANNTERHAQLMAEGNGAALQKVADQWFGGDVSQVDPSKVTITWHDPSGAAIPTPTPSDLPSDAVPNAQPLDAYTYFVSVFFIMEFDFNGDGIPDISFPWSSGIVMNSGNSLMLIDNGPGPPLPDEIYDAGDPTDPDSIRWYFTLNRHYRDDRSGNDWKGRARKTYRVPSARLNLNTASAEVLAAMIHGTGRVLIEHQNDPNNSHKKITFYHRPNIHLHENGHPMNLVYGANFQGSDSGNFGFNPEFPLFSVTESLKMARDLKVRVAAQPFTDLNAELFNWFINWTDGRDGRRRTSFQQIDISEGQRVANNGAESWWDRPQNMTRERLLWSITSEARGADRLLNEAAIPDLFAPDEEWHFQNHYHANSAGTAQANQGDKGTLQFDRLSHQTKTTTFNLNDGRYRIRSQGLYLGQNGAVLSRASLVTIMDLYDVRRFDTQSEFEKVLEPNQEFITYPEIPGNSMVVTCDWDGWIALRPNAQDPELGFVVVMDYPMDPYLNSTSPTSANSGIDWLSSETPQGLFMADKNWQGGHTSWPRNSQLLPVPGNPAGSVLARSPTHLTPGGGIRIPDEDNFVDNQGDWHIQTRTLELPFLPTDFAGQSIADGALSFWVKPTDYVSYTFPGGVSCLANVTFIVHDPVLEAAQGSSESYFNGRIELFYGNLNARRSNRYKEGYLLPKLHIADPNSYGGGSIGMQGRVEPAYSIGGLHSKYRPKFWATFSLALRRNVNTSRIPAGVPVFEMNTGVANMPWDPAADYVMRRHAVLTAPFETGADALIDPKAANNQFVETNPLESGRWLHVAMAWRNMDGLDDLNRGVLGLWLNGTLKKTRPWSGRNYTMDGEFFAENYISTESSPYTLNPVAENPPGPPEDAEDQKGTHIRQSGFSSYLGNDDSNSGGVPQNEHLFEALANKWYVGHLPFQAYGEQSGFNAVYGKPYNTDNFSYMNMKMWSGSSPLHSGNWLNVDLPTGVLSPLPLQGHAEINLGKILPWNAGSLREVRLVVWIPPENFMEFNQLDDCKLELSNPSLGISLNASRVIIGNILRWQGNEKIISASHLDFDLDYKSNANRTMTGASPLVRSITTVTSRSTPGVIMFNWK